MEYAILFFVVIAFLIGLVQYKARAFVYRHQLGVRVRYRPDYGYVYFYRARWSNPFLVKIGRSNNWQSRLSSARTSMPHGIHIYGIAMVKDDVFAESYIHKKYSDKRLTKKNEWFILTISLWFYIRHVRNNKLTRLATRTLAL